MTDWKIRRILHPTDFSEQAEAALDYALDLAVRAGAELHVLHVVAGFVPYAADARDLSLHEAEDLAIRMRETVNARLGSLSHAQLDKLDVAYELAEGRRAAAAIVEHAGRHGTDLVVLGTHGRQGLRHLFLGSVAEEVLRKAPCPVLALRKQKTGPKARLAHIVVPVDFSELTGPALAQAKRLAAHYDASLTLLFVAEEHVVPFFSDTGIPTFGLKKIDPEIIEHAEEALRELDAATPGPEVPTRYVVRDGQPTYEIVDFAKEVEADFLVMATHGLSGVERRLMGSVTERVVRTAPCPVWTVNPLAVVDAEGASATAGAADNGS